MKFSLQNIQLDLSCLHSNCFGSYWIHRLDLPSGYRFVICFDKTIKMEIRNLLRIIFRIFGLYTVTNLTFHFLPQQISYLINSKIYFPFDNQESGITQIWIYLFVVILLIILVFYLLIINPDLIINKLRPKSFLEEKVSFENLNTENMLKIAILSIGILILFDSMEKTVKLTT